MAIKKASNQNKTRKTKLTENQKKMLLIRGERILRVDEYDEYFVAVLENGMKIEISDIMKRRKVKKCPYKHEIRKQASPIYGECSYYDVEAQGKKYCSLPFYKGICPVISAKGNEETENAELTKPLSVHPLIRDAIRKAVIKALKAKPVKVNAEEAKWDFYEIDGEIWSENDAIEHILNQYSWWKEPTN